MVVLPHSVLPGGGGYYAGSSSPGRNRSRTQEPFAVLLRESNALVCSKSGYVQMCEVSHMALQGRALLEKEGTYWHFGVHDARINSAKEDQKDERS